MIKSIKSGFTLAEVLTTLMVIGVVAAMTIPTLMNSTQNQQAQVAAKKAASVLSQATQLFVAKDESCTIGSSDNKNNRLAQCFSKVISGSVSGNTINTADGMLYTFYAAKTGDDLNAICGSKVVSYNGQGNCAVIVDTNGGAKGTAPADFTYPTTFNAQGFTSAQSAAGSDIIPFSLSASSVRPMAFSGTGANNKGWKFILGSDAPTSVASKACYKGTATPCSGDGVDTSYTQYADLLFIDSTDTCPTGYSDVTDPTKALEVGDTCPSAS